MRGDMNQGFPIAILTVLLFGGADALAAPEVSPGAYDIRAFGAVADGKTKCTKMKRDKGHEREIQLTIDAMRGGGSSPIPFEQLVEVSQSTIAIQEAIATGSVVLLGAPTKLVPAVSVRSSEP